MNVVRLVLKDAAAAHWVLPVMLGLYVIQAMGMASSRPGFLLVAFAFSGVLAFGSIVVEEVQGTESLWCSLPVSRRDVVRARYLAALTGMALGLALSWAVDRLVLLWTIHGPERTTPHLGTPALAGMFSLLVLGAALYLPCYFRLGAGRGLTMFSILFLGLLVLVSVLGSLGIYLAGGEEALAAFRRRDSIELSAWLARARVWLTLAGPALSVALLAVSSALSSRFYARRDC